MHSSARQAPPRPAYEPFVGLPATDAIHRLRRRRQWVSWDYVCKPGKQKADKVPIDPRTGGYGSSTDPRTWGECDEAVERAKADELPGVGYALTADDEVTGYDLDGCRDPATGVFEPWAADVLALAETYAEVSPSGRGLRLFAEGKVAAALAFQPAGVELYGTGRYLTVTGRHVEGTPTEIRPAPRTLAALRDRIDEFKAKAAAEKAAQQEADAEAARRAGTKSSTSSKARSGLFGDNFFRRVNTAALENLAAWVPAIWPGAKPAPGPGGYRISSAALGRDLEEDLSLSPEGIVDFGVHDMGDARDGKRTAIDVVMEFAGAADASAAALWLCDRLGLDPSSLGWNGRRTSADSGGGLGGGTSEDGESEPAERRVIQVVAAEMPRVVDETEDAVLAAGLPIYTRAGDLVRPITDIVPASKGRTTTAARLKPLCIDSAADILAREMTFQKYNERKKDWVGTDPPRPVLAALLARDGSWRLPSIAGVVTTPTLRPDGTLIDRPGYDPATRLYLVEDKTLTMPPVPENPTRAEGAAALDLLRALLVGFPFAGAADRAVALSGILTAVVRGGLDVAPLHAFRASTPGTGKSLLVDVASAIATGRPCPVIAAGATPEETEKRLGALLRDGVPVVSLDNVNDELGGDMLCQMVERPLVRVRILGKSEAPELECRSAVFATGNGLTLVGDMTRRALVCSLDAGMERPEKREFDFEPVARVLADRGSYVAAALTIVRAYRAAGSPKVCGALGSYGEWTAAVRAPLVWLDEADPVASMETARNEDPELTAIRELFGHWKQHLLLSEGYTTSSLIKSAVEKRAGAGLDFNTPEFVFPEFRDLLLRQAGDGGAINSRRLGKWLSKITGRVVDGHRIEMKVDGSHGNRFALCQPRKDEAARGGF